MVKLLIGHKGTGKTKMMIELANTEAEKSDGNIIFINKNARLMYDLKYKIRVVCMEDYEHVTNSDEYIGFLYGIISSDHDIKTIYIDSILKHADFSLGDLPEFLTRLKNISKDYGMDFVVSLSAEKEEMIGVDFADYEVLNEYIIKLKRGGYTSSNFFVCNCMSQETVILDMTCRKLYANLSKPSIFILQFSDRYGFRI